MLFNSLEFFVFLIVVFLVYWYVTNRQLTIQNLTVLVASYMFYGWWDYRFLSLIILSTLVDFFVGQKMYQLSDIKTKRKWLWVSLGFNLGLLGIFKYFNFFIDSWIALLHSFGINLESSWSLKIILPVGISFYTFQTMSYTIDIYRKKIKPTNNFLAFASFVSFFPQLVAGPIERASNLLPQFFTLRVFKYSYISSGIKLMIYGFFLKLVVADRAAIYVNTVYNNVESHDGLTLAAATLLFAFQIYGDFAGYSLIAIGTAKLFGFDLMTNFRRPYFAKSVSEFWTRWHISLSTWFRDYLYIPLGGSRVKKPRWLFNLFVTFLISGLWHGANWTFVIWGALNGIYLILEVLLLKGRKTTIVNLIVTFILINFSWIFFRANSLTDAKYIIYKIITKPGTLFIGIDDDVTAIIYTTIAIIMLLIVEIKKEYFNSVFTITKSKYEMVRMSAYAVLIFIILYLGVFEKSQFIYFQF